MGSTVTTDPNGVKALDPAPSAAGGALLLDNDAVLSALRTIDAAGIAANVVDVAANVADIATNEADIARIDKAFDGVRVADNYTDADYGDKVNAAIDDLGARGGTVLMRPDGETEFASTINVSKGIRLLGTRVPTITSEGIPPRDTGGTSLTYTGTGHAIAVGDDADTLHYGNAFERFLLKCSNVNCITGIYFAKQNYRTQFVDLELHGPGSAYSTIGIDIPYYGGTTSSWQTGYGCAMRRFGVALRLEIVNQTAWHNLTLMFNAVGVQTVNFGHSQTFVGGVYENNGISFDLQYSKAISIIGVYNEDSTAANRFIVAGGGVGGHCQGLTVINPYMNAGSVCDHSIVLDRALNVTIIGGVARNQLVSVIDNQSASASYKNYQAIGLQSEDVEVWNNYTRVVMTNNLAGRMIYPNMPTSDPVVLGELWSDSGTVKVSAGP